MKTILLSIALFLAVSAQAQVKHNLKIQIDTTLHAVNDSMHANSNKIIYSGKSTKIAKSWNISKKDIKQIIKK